MKKWTYYNENDPKKAATLRQLMKDGYITDGVVDERSIKDVEGKDLQGFWHCSFFAGIGLWDYALDLAGWEEGRRVWTGSCPCQPFSSAGRQGGRSDDRHLWPEWLRLIEEYKPPTIFGEQVAAAVAQGWLDDVYQGLEAQDYAVGAVVLPASSVGAPHRRERLWFVAHGDMHRCKENRERITETWCNGIVGNSGTLDDSNSDEHQCTKSGIDGEAESVSSEYRTKDSSRRVFGRTGATASHVGDSDSEGSQGHTGDGEGSDQSRRYEEKPQRSAWSSGVWIDCPDGKQRLVEPGIPLLANGFPERVGVIHCAGDAIVPQVAAEFIKAAM